MSTTNPTIRVSRKNDDLIKTIVAEDYKSALNLRTGDFVRYGTSLKDNPILCKYGSEIMDIEIGTSCNKGCAFCYKSNTPNGTYMSFTTFKQLFSKLPKTVGQIAFGIGSLIGNPDTFRIFEYCRENNVVPNITINDEDISLNDKRELIRLCGSIAVSVYDKNATYKMVDDLTSLGAKQVNLHMLLCKERYVECFELITDYNNHQHLENLNAIVFLWLKPKGDRNVFTQVMPEEFDRLVKFAFLHKIPIGFDSCSASFFEQFVKNNTQYEYMLPHVEPCESTLFSYYINVDGIGFPCSFCEGECNYKGINVLECDDFIKDVWNHTETNKFREACLKNNRKCPQFKLGE